DEDQRRGTRTAWLTPAWSKRLDVFGVAAYGGGLDRRRDSLQQRVVGAASRPPFAAAFQVQLFLDFVPARVSHLVAEVSQLGQVAAECAVGDAGAVSELEGIEARLGDDRGQNSQQPSQPLRSVQRLSAAKTRLSLRPDSLRPSPRRLIPNASHRCWCRRGFRGGGQRPHPRFS